ncbi:unnamed protein product (mitochondrion) [Plasmodiophora brassicae]|uniref:Uncharacterized protein n=1 Tax=Plasmodiophora brassicae TaxID=37360 RepID=A0A3P3YAN7_PLABS|nr:unnamed protein product [Plasmodiophora brassicae]
MRHVPPGPARNCTPMSGACRVSLSSQRWFSVCPARAARDQCPVRAAPPCPVRAAYQSRTRAASQSPGPVRAAAPFVERELHGRRLQCARCRRQIVSGMLRRLLGVGRRRAAPWRPVSPAWYGSDVECIDHRKDFDEHMAMAEEQLRRLRPMEAQRVLSRFPASALQNDPVLLARLLTKQMMIPMIHSEDAAGIGVDDVEAIHQRFAPFLTGAVTDPDIVTFVSHLVLAYGSFGRVDVAQELIDSKLGDDDVVMPDDLRKWRALEADHCRAVLYFGTGKSPQAEAKLRSALLQAQELLASVEPDSLAHKLIVETCCAIHQKLCHLAFVQEKFDDCALLLSTSSDEIAKMKGVHDITVHRMLFSLVAIHHKRDNAHEVVNTAKKILQNAPKTHGEAAVMLAKLSELISGMSMEYVDFCLELCTASIDIFGQLAIENVHRGHAYSHYATLLNALKRYEEGMAAATTALQDIQGALGDHDHALGPVYHTLGVAALGLNKPAEAIPYLDRAQELLDPENDQRLAIIYGHLGEAHEKTGDREQAEKMITKAVNIKRVCMPDTTQLAVDMQNLAAMKQRSGHKADSVMLHEEAVEIYRNQLGSQSYQTAWARCLLGAALTSAGQLDRACDAFAEGVPVVRAHNKTPTTLLRPILMQYYQVLLACGQTDRASAVQQDISSLAPAHQ